MNINLQNSIKNKGIDLRNDNSFDNFIDFYKSKSSLFDLLKSGFAEKNNKNNNHNNRKLEQISVMKRKKNKNDLIQYKTISIRL
jgi:hypothetical protein